MKIEIYYRKEKEENKQISLIFTRDIIEISDVLKYLK
jgi:hypothetical protein